MEQTGPHLKEGISESEWLKTDTSSAGEHLILSATNQFINKNRLSNRNIITAYNLIMTLLPVSKRANTKRDWELVTSFPQAGDDELI